MNMPENPFNKINKISATSHEANVGVVKELLSEEEGEEYKKLQLQQITTKDITLTEGEKLLLSSSERLERWDEQTCIEWALSIGFNPEWFKSRFRFVEDNLIESKKLIIGSNKSLTQLPPNLFQVKGYLELKDCSSLTKLPERLAIIEGNLILSQCISLIKIPSMTVWGGVDLDGCRNIRVLPNYLNIGNYLSLIGCLDLSYLPEELHVGGSFVLDQNSPIQLLPKSLKVRGDIYVPEHLKQQADTLKNQGRIQGEVKISEA